MPPRSISQPLLLGLWGLVLLVSGLSGRLDLLLHGAFHGLVGGAGMVLLLLAAGLLLAPVWAGLRARGFRSLGRGRQALRQQRTPSGSPLASGRTRRSQGTGPERLPLPWLLSGLVGIAVLLVPPDPSFTVLASSRPEGLPDPPTLAFILPPEQRSLSEWVRLLRRRPDPALYDGQAVRISGFVLPQPDGAPLLARLQVRCCLADATPMGLPVAWPKGFEPRQNQWLAIEGRMTTAFRRGEPISVVQPRRIRTIPRPRRPLEP